MLKYRTYQFVYLAPTANNQREPKMLVPERVEAIYLECLYRYDDTTRKILTVISPIELHVLLHPDKIRTHKAEIESMLAMLPSVFHIENGDGAPISCARRTCSGEVWTMNTDTVNMVLVLGMAIDRVWLTRPCDDTEIWAHII